MPNKYLVVQAGGLRSGKTFLGRTILHGVTVLMNKLAQRGAKLKL
jgi:pantothenate kinase type III